MKIKILKQTFVKGQLAKADDVIDASEQDAISRLQQIERFKLDKLEPTSTKQLVKYLKWIMESIDDYVQGDIKER